MNGKFLLDTNIVIALFAEEPSVKENISVAKQVFLPRIVLGELYYGAYKSSRTEKNIARLDEFTAANAILGPGSVTAREYGYIKHILLNKGRPIPENDIWIAALAKQHNLTLVTRDDHFKEIEGISIESWSREGSCLEI